MKPDKPFVGGTAKQFLNWLYRRRCKQNEVDNAWSMLGIRARVDVANTLHKNAEVKDQIESQQKNYATISATQLIGLGECN